jgi:quinol monooxygenase YgiN
MSRFGLMASMSAQPGQRDALVSLLLEAVAVLETLPDCELWIVSTSSDDPDAVWVSEVWRSQADHAASLANERIQAIIGRGRPLIARFGERTVLQPVGGKGLAEADPESKRDGT